MDSPNRIEIIGPFPPPTGLCGPFARRTAYHVYRVYKDGRQLIGGTYGPDPDAEGAERLALRYADEKGVMDPAVVVRKPA